tara:strand:+ start:16465 stop:17256 length:792 start_codon:yes stop_codon:yes gene_type:complete
MDHRTPGTENAFPAEWYGLSDAEHFWMKWRLGAWQAMAKTCAINLAAEGQTRALDIGCGIGTFRRQVEGISSWTVDGCDNHPAAAEHQVVTRGRYREFDIFNGPEEAQSAYQHVFLFDVLEHIDDDVDFLRAAAHYVGKDGFVHINVPASQMLFSRYDVVVGHLRRYTLKSLTRLAESAGIRVHACGYWGLSLVPVAALRKLMLSTWGRRFTDGQVLTHGLKPPGAFANQALATLGACETALFARTWLGTSVMLIGTKANSQN